MTVSSDETEAKYDAPLDAALPELGGLPQVTASVRLDGEELDAEYYDTGDLRLLCAGITLRRRRGGGRRRVAPEAAAGWRHAARDPATARPG